jgi:hypothetical protein
LVRFIAVALPNIITRKRPPLRGFVLTPQRLPCVPSVLDIGNRERRYQNLALISSSLGLWTDYATRRQWPCTELAESKLLCADYSGERFQLAETESADIPEETL